MKAFGYIRVSGAGQVDGDGPIRQEHAIRAFAASKGIEIDRFFHEDGVCGAIETTERPAFIEMLTALMSNGVRTVIIEKLDRLSRDLVVQETAIRHFQQEGFSLLSADPGEVDLLASDPSRILMRQIFGAIAQYEKGMIVAKLRAARNRAKASSGRCEGQKPYVSLPDGKAALDRIKTLRDEGYGFDKIAYILNSEGVPTKRGGRWHAPTISRMIGAAA